MLIEEAKQVVQDEHFQIAFFAQPGDDSDSDISDSGSRRGQLPLDDGRQNCVNFELSDQQQLQSDPNEQPDE